MNECADRHSGSSNRGAPDGGDSGTVCLPVGSLPQRGCPRPRWHAQVHAPRCTPPACPRCGSRLIAAQGKAYRLPLGGKQTDCRSGAAD